MQDLEVAALGDELTQADLLALDRYAERTADRVWRLRRERLLAAVESGDSIDRVRELLAARSAAPLPDTVACLLDDVAQRTAALTDRGSALLIECADPALAVLPARDRRTRAHCLLAGDRMLAVPAASDAAFRRAARELGYVVGGATARAAWAERSPSRRSAGRSPAEVASLGIKVTVEPGRSRVRRSPCYK